MSIKVKHSTIVELQKTADLYYKHCKRNKITISIPDTITKGKWAEIVDPILESHRNEIPKGECLYFLFSDTGDLLYIGKSAKAYSRLRAHLVKKSKKTKSKLADFQNYILNDNKKSISFCAIAIEPSGLNAYFESYLQNKYNPPWVHRKS